MALNGRVEKSLLLLNEGEGAVAISRLAVDDRSGFFGLAAQAPGEVPAGGRVEVKLYYSPSAAGAHTATLVVTNDSSNAPDLEIPLTGSAREVVVCGGVTCDHPPDACHSMIGRCESGTCVYPLAPGTSCDDHNPCTEGDACDAQGSCAGTPKSCTTPPAPTCRDANTQRVFDLPGSCGLMGCTYPSRDMPCSSGCDAATGACRACVPKSCTDQAKSCGPASDGCGRTLQCGTCTTAPPSSCVNATTRRSYALPGTCSTSGSCQFATSDFTCPSGCDASTGRCANCSPTTCSALGRSCGTTNDGCGDPLDCGGCTTPPAPTCISSTTRRTFSATGTCDAQGRCSYTAQDTTCTNGCDASTGACRSCSATSCTAQGKNCGTISDGCGGTLNCGATCPTGQTCTNNVCTTTTTGCNGSCSSLFDCSAGYACDRAKGCCVPCGGSGQICCVDQTNLVFTCNSPGDVCGRSSGSGATENYYCCKNAGDGCCNQGGCGGGTCCKCPRNGLNFCVQPSFGCGGC